MKNLAPVRGRRPFAVAQGGASSYAQNERLRDGEATLSTDSGNRLERIGHVRPFQSAHRIRWQQPCTKRPQLEDSSPDPSQPSD